MWRSFWPNYFVDVYTKKLQVPVASKTFLRWKSTIFQDKKINSGAVKRFPNLKSLYGKIANVWTSPMGKFYTNYLSWLLQSDLSMHRYKLGSINSVNHLVMIPSLLLNELNKNWSDKLYQDDNIFSTISKLYHLST